MQTSPLLPWSVPSPQPVPCPYRKAPMAHGPIPAHPPGRCLARTTPAVLPPHHPCQLTWRGPVPNGIAFCANRAPHAFEILFSFIHSNHYQKPCYLFKNISPRSKSNASNPQQFFILKKNISYNVRVVFMSCLLSLYNSSNFILCVATIGINYVVCF